ncbi:MULTISPECIES: hypothetical protein [unclassified Tatumella]|uniref:hypothetical protein n=1 Tax=unclassified Tatumella TaxID=2649542 RepID=UPI001BAFB2B4|nr:MULTISPECIES: hypothetical protein [unclassified Tatumella]MBS0878871.1 hypothetical protein [Tatumella sp. JGM82]MBS0892396.1 hypothetical protein [Tatumella sp. JGM94]
MKILNKLRKSFIVNIAKKISLSKLFWLCLSVLFGFLANHALDENNHIVMEHPDPDNLHIILKVIQDMIDIAINGQ